MRLDKWFWCVRVFKSRTLATEACNGGKVKVKGRRVKPSHEIKIGEVVAVQDGYAKREYKVKGLLGKRLSAKLIGAYVQDITPPEELIKQSTLHLKPFYRERGLGRPTKKERRLIDKIKS